MERVKYLNRVNNELVFNFTNLWYYIFLFAPNSANNKNFDCFILKDNI